jgi:hypothetical protein
MGLPPNMNIKVVTSHIAHAYGINVMNPGQLHPLGSYPAPLWTQRLPQSMIFGLHAAVV